MNKDPHVAYSKYIEFLKMIPLEDLKLALIRQVEKQVKASYQVEFLAEELKRRELK
jgi:hypothetical protein